jgi:molybdopterin converting factor small subunit
MGSRRREFDLPRPGWLPGIRFRVIDEQDRMRPHVRFFVNGQAVGELSHALRPKDAVVIVPALSGG